MTIGAIVRVCDRARADARAGHRAERQAGGVRHFTWRHWNAYVRAWNRERDRMRAEGRLPQGVLPLDTVQNSVAVDARPV